MTLLSPRYKNIDNKISRQGGGKKKKEICCLLKVQINLEVRWIEYNFQQILCIVNVEISKEVYYSSSYSKASVIFF